MPDIQQLLLILFIVLIAANIQGAAGFGYGLSALGLLGLFIDIKDATNVINISGAFLNVIILLRLKEHIPWRDVWPICLASTLGIPLGILFLVRANATTMQMAVGIVLLACVVQNLLPKANAVRWHRYWLGLPMGVFSGALSGAFSTGGPPMVAYLSTQGWDRLRYSAAIQCVLLVASSTRLIGVTASGVLTLDVVKLGLLCCVISGIGASTGVILLKWMSDQTLKRITLCFLFLLGSYNIITSW